MEAEEFEQEWKRYCDAKGSGAVTINLKDVAKHFAEWQKEQIMKDAVEADIAESFTPVSESPNIYMHGFTCVYEEKESTPYVVAPCKVKLIIIKE